MTTRRDFLKSAGNGLVVALVAPRLSSLPALGESAELSRIRATSLSGGRPTIAPEETVRRSE